MQIENPLVCTDTREKNHMTKAHYKTGCFLFFTLYLLFFPSYAKALPNPAAIYCTWLGYDYNTARDTAGNQYGLCWFPDKSKANAWDFYRGKAGKKFSYCAKKGYLTETKRDEKNGFVSESAVCVIPGATQGKAETRMPLKKLMEQNGDYLFDNAHERPATTSSSQPEMKNFTSEVNGTIPDSFDWRNRDGHTYIGSVRDQGSCGACYAFGAAAAAEGTYNFATKRYDTQCIDFSEAFIVWCLGKYGPYSSHFSGCGGADYEYKELEALTREGITKEENFPYTGTDPGSCTHWDDPVTIFDAWGRIASNDIEAIKTALMEHGVLDVAVYATDAFLNYSGGIFQDKLTSCPSGAYTTTNHAVSLVGWGNDPEIGDYWILRNSWGSSWGEDGYMRIEAYSARVGCAPTCLTCMPEQSDKKVTIIPVINMLLYNNR